jgi:FkbM family methyltransferase
MAQYLYQLRTGFQLFPRLVDRVAFLAARLSRQARWIPMPASLRMRAFTVAGVDRPVMIRPHTADFMVTREMFLKKEYQNLIQPLPSPGQVRFVLDLGSNIGLSLRLWEQMFDRPTVVALEPDAANAEVCRQNIALSADPSRMTLLQAGIAATSGELWLEMRHSTLGHRTSGQASENATRIPVFSVPDVLNKVGHDGPIDLLKCDIEGAEDPLFADCGSWIHCVRSMVIETHDDYTLDRLQADLRRAGSTLRLVGEDDRDPQRPLAYFLATPFAINFVPDHRFSGVC